MIELREISLSTGSFSLSCPALSIGEGECHVIVGATGAGKTLLLETVLGLRRQDGGSVMISGTDVSGLPPSDRNISYVPQDVCLFPNMSVSENIRYGLRMRGLSSPEHESFLARLIEILGVGNILSRGVATLSGGERQRVALARALAPRPALIALDEPFSAIDSSAREETARALKRLHEELRATILLVTHDFDEAFFLGDRISVMMDGKVLQTGCSEEVYRHPASAAVASFLGVRNLFGGTIASIGDGRIVIDWPESGRSVVTRCTCRTAGFAPGDRIFWGIRSDEVNVLHPGKPFSDKENVFTARVGRILHMGKIITFTAVLDVKEPIEIEVEIHHAAARRVKLAENPSAAVSLNPDWIFMVRQ